MQQVKIAFFDIDGTLIVTGSKGMSAKTEETLRRLQEKQVKICIATGRPPFAIPKFTDIQFDAYLSFNASLVYSQGKVIFKNPIPKADVLKIAENSQRINHPILVANESRMGANGIEKDLKDYLAFSHQDVEVVDDFDELIQQDIYQIMQGGTAAEYPQMLQGVSGARITAWWPRAVDIIPANGGKGLGVAKTLEYFHLRKEEAIAFGDGGNDVDMLEAVGTGVAMGNAEDEVKAKADDVCGRVEDDGIYHYCIDHQLI